jgi:anti-anti-sigma factor
MSTHVLEDKLSGLRAKKRVVDLDLSKLEFIDSTGLRLLIRALGDARTDGWELQLDGELSPTVECLFRLVHLDRLASGNGAGTPA